MVTYTEFIDAYGKKKSELKKIKTCSHQDCNEEDVSFIDASNRLNANLIHDGSVDNTEFGYLNGVTSAIQTQIDGKAGNGFAVAMAIAL
jgi:hypothetical protein